MVRTMSSISAMPTATRINHFFPDMLDLLCGHPALPAAAIYQASW
jgi:hypothetical protein